MAQSQNFTNAIFENSVSEYETIGDRTTDEYVNLEIQPHVVQVDSKVNNDEEIITDKKHKKCLKKNVCIGVLIAVIVVLVIVIAVTVSVFLSSKTQGGSCTKYTDIRNGQIIRSTGSRHGDTLEFQCDKNSKLNGPNTSTCLSSGEWSADPHCVLKECGKFLLPQHIVANSNASLTVVGSKISLFCQEGFNLSGNSYVICQIDEEWSESPTCNQVDCGLPKVITNSKQVLVEKTSYNSSFTVECIDGFTLIGTEAVKCNLEGHWSDLPECEIVSCEIPNIPAHGSVKNLTSTLFKSTVTIKCDEGYSMHGISVISCTSNGNWTDLPTCKLTDFCESSPCKNGSCVPTCNCLAGHGGLHCEKVMTDCLDIFNEGGITDGIYEIRTWKTHQVIQVYCDMTTAGGGWTVFQYRFDKSVDFYRNFSEYENGFGDLQSEFWLGLKYIQEIASQNTTYLRVDMVAENDTTAYESFDMFELSPTPDYTLYLGDTLSSSNILKINLFAKRHNGFNFTTFDNDVDISSMNCASLWGGGWWYYNCLDVDLNGHRILYHGYKLRQSKMMMRRT